MTIRNFDFLLAPRSVALVGASDRPGSVGRIVAGNLLAGGFRGPVHLVNPRRIAIDGHMTHGSIAELPEAPDLAVVATPPATVPGVIGELAEKGTRAAVVLTAGIRGELRQAMLDASRSTKLRIQGPNCLGLMLPGIGLDASFSHRAPPAGDLAFVSQSGALVTAVVDWAASRGIGFSHVVSIGDMADVDFGDMLDYLAGDVKSRAILLYMETLTDAPKFMSAARRAARVKPVIAIKAGRHEAGARAAFSHTGALAGADRAFEAAFRRAGVLRVLDLEDLFAAAETLSRVPRLDGDRLMIVTNGGGAGVLAADRLADLGGTLATLDGALIAQLDAELPATWSRANPIDIIGDASPERWTAALGLLLGDPGSDAILALDCPTALASGEAVAEALTGAVARHVLAGKPQKPMLTCWLGEEAAREPRRRFAEARIATYPTPAAAIMGFMHLVGHNRAQSELMRTPPAMPDRATPDRVAAARIIEHALQSGRERLREHEAKALLAAYGIPVVETRFASDADEVARFAEALLAQHAACAIKVVSDDLPHKSDVGGVCLGLDSAAAAADAAREMLARIGTLRPAARIDGFTVQPMISRPRAHELLLGMTTDATFGPLLLFGSGGTAVEVLADTAAVLPPLDLKLAEDAMRATRVWRLLRGFRDRPPADLGDIAAALVGLSALVTAHPEVHEVDVNPLLADATGVVALDARILVRDPVRTPRRPMAIRPYPSAWVQGTSVAGIGNVQLRPIRPEDEHLFADFLARVTPDDIRLRLLSPVRHLSHQFIARLTQIDYAREMAFVAITPGPGGGELLGVVRLVADPDYRRAEYAVLVRSDLKGRGLGWTLMQHLITYARAEGLAELFGSVLTENSTMLAMCRELGFHISPDRDDAALRYVELRL